MAAVESYRVLTAEQVAALVFPVPNGLRKAQKRLKRLCELDVLHRCWPAWESGYAYYVGKRHGRLEHQVALNWVRLWLGRTLPSWETIERWEYEAAHGTLQADGFCSIRNRVTGARRHWFVECDRVSSGNPWNKVALYNRLYESGGYREAWWFPEASGFPSILCVSDHPARAAVIRKSVERENRDRLRFEVRILDELVKEARRT